MRREDDKVVRNAAFDGRTLKPRLRMRDLPWTTKALTMLAFVALVGMPAVTERGLSGGGVSVREALLLGPPDPLLLAMPFLLIAPMAAAEVGASGRGGRVLANFCALVATAPIGFLSTGLLWFTLFEVTPVEAWEIVISLEIAVICLVGYTLLSAFFVWVYNRGASRRALQWGVSDRG